VKSRLLLPPRISLQLALRRPARSTVQLGLGCGGEDRVLRALLFSHPLRVDIGSNVFPGYNRRRTRKAAGSESLGSLASILLREINTLFSRRRCLRLRTEWLTRLELMAVRLCLAQAECSLALALRPTTPVSDKCASREHQKMGSPKRTSTLPHSPTRPIRNPPRSRRSGNHQLKDGLKPRSSQSLRPLAPPCKLHPTPEPDPAADQFFSPFQVHQSSGFDAQISSLLFNLLCSRDPRLGVVRLTSRLRYCRGRLFFAGPDDRATQPLGPGPDRTNLICL